jgi:L-alanine-DL-glutamate epimerase-like enolase superfamily enzyme
MRIVDVKAYVIEAPVRRRRHWAHGLPPDPLVNELCWLQVVTDEGVDGWALSDHGHIVADVTRRCLVGAVKGEDPLLKERLWRKIWDVDRAEELPIYVLGLLDVALWDITGKVAGLPLYQLLGGARDRCPAYASTATWPTQEEYLTRAEQCLSIGYRAIKIHAWGDAGADARLAMALRDGVGSEVDLMYDGSARFRYEEALRLGRALEEAQFLWYEEPMLEFNTWQYARLCRDLDIPVLAPETADGAHFNAADFVAHDATDILRTSAEYKGGITGAIRIAHLADSFGMRAEVHGEGLPNIHLCCAIPNTRYYETFVVEDPVAENEERGELTLDEDGCVHPPDRPGIGWIVDPAELAQTAVRIE